MNLVRKKDEVVHMKENAIPTKATSSIIEANEIPKRGACQRDSVGIGHDQLDQLDDQLDAHYQPNQARHRLHCGLYTCQSSLIDLCQCFKRQNAIVAVQSCKQR